MNFEVSMDPHALALELRRIAGAECVVRENEPLARRTTLRVGGPADVYFEPASELDLQAVTRFCSGSGIPFMMLGRGSNLLVRDGGIRGVVIGLGAPFARIEFEGEQVRCGAGARLRDVAMAAKKHSLAGLEFMEGIPGNIGGGLRMNAGAMGSSVFEVVDSVRIMSCEGSIEERALSEIPFEYRNCPLLKTHIALSAVLRGRNDDRTCIERRMAECSQKRWTSQPAAPSAGCIFKNSPTVPTGRLVQELGLKGTRVGGARISDEHGNFIVNDGQAKARDVLELIDLIKETARAKRGIELHTEVQIVGEDA
jgi:UDP-N-acetylenolpyruvoylglucosamine reductase